MGGLSGSVSLLASNSIYTLEALHEPGEVPQRLVVHWRSQRQDVPFEHTTSAVQSLS